MIEEREKLWKLLEHWKIHNVEHAESYKLWAQKMDILGEKELSKILYEIYNLSLKIGELFDKAKETKK